MLQDQNRSLEDIFLNGYRERFCAFLNRPIRASWGADANKPYGWKAGEPSTLKAQLDRITELRLVPRKGGSAYLQGPLKAGQDRRTAENMERLDCAVFDIDNGQLIDDIIAAAEDEGIYILAHPSFSHMKRISTAKTDSVRDFVNKDKKARWAKLDDFEEANDEQVIAYFREFKGYRESVLTTACFDGRSEHEYVISHDPLPRYRVIVPFTRSLMLSELAPTLKGTKAKWRAMYLEIGGRLSIEHFDEKCDDLSRLFFAHQRPLGSPDEAIRVEGEGVDPYALRAFTAKPEDSKGPKGAKSSHTQEAKPSASPGAWQTAGLGRLWSKNGTRFDAPRFIVDQCGAIEKSAGKAEGCCPFKDNHSPTEGPDDATMYAYAPDGAGGLAHIGCNHTGCKAYTTPRFIDEICAQNGLTAPDLMEYVELTEEEQAADDARDLGADYKKLVAAVEALPEDPKDQNPDDISRIIAALATRDDDPQLDRILVLLKARVKRPMKELMRWLKSARIKYENSRVTGTTKADGFFQAPPEGQEHTARCVRGEWDHRDCLRTARAKFELGNGANPLVFKGLDGRHVRLVPTRDGLSVAPMSGQAWAHEIGKHVEYRKTTSSEGDKGRALPAPIVDEVCGAPDLALPVLEKVIRVPLFTPSGVLRTERGYIPELGIYLAPQLDDFEAPPETPTNEDIAMAVGWLEESVCDVAFSDGFDGNEPLPYKIGEPDATGYRETNFARGKASRWNFYGLVVDAHVRHLVKGPGPATHIDKAVPGEGAGLLMNLVSIIDTGEEAHIRTVSKEVDEFEKRLPAAYVGHDSRVFWDNFTGKIRSDTLAAWLTTNRMKVRRFGQNDVELSISTTASTVFAGNNGRFHRDLVERMVPIRLYSGLKHPAIEREARKAEFFKHADHAAFVKSIRCKLLWSIHVLIRAWFVDGCPGATVKHPRFPGWSDVVGGILENACRRLGVPCPFLTNLDDYLSGANDEADAFGAVYQRIVDGFGGEAFSMSEALDTLRVLGGGIDPALNLPIGGKSAHGEVVSFSGLFNDELKGRPFDVLVSPVTAAKYGWAPLNGGGGDRVRVLLKFIRAGKADALRWKAVPAEC